VLLRFAEVCLAYGARPLLDHVSLQIEARERVCVVGRNGEGKSSLLRLARGDAHPDEGTVWRRNGLRLGWLPQDIAEHGEQTVGELIAAGLPDGSDGESWRAAQRITEIASRLRLDPEARYADLSGGWRRRALLAQALAGEPELLLLDEPTNHLDIAAIEWLEQALLQYRGALLFVSHDRRFMNRLATRVAELDRGHLFVSDGDYDTYVSKKEQLLAAEAQADALFDKRLAQEEVWIRKGVEARRTRNEGRVRALYALREAHRQRRTQQGRIEMVAQDTSESGRLVFEAEDATVELGGRAILRNVSTRIHRGDRIGIVGPNGAGKSTLLRLILGELTPTHGSVRLGTRLEIAYYDQERAQLKLDESVMHNVVERGDHVFINGASRHVSSYLRDFLFRSDQLQTPARALSGGERNRLLLAKLFAQPANLLVLDEPTNDLDIDTLELLEEFVAAFQGTLLLVSHDRAFLDNVVTDLLVLDGSGSVQDFVGGYSDWERYRAAQRAAADGGAVGARPARNTSASEAAANASGTGASAVAMSAAAVPRTAKPKKLSYKDQRELDALPAKLAALEAEKAVLEAAIAEPSFYALPHDQVQRELQRVGALATEIEGAYARWAALEALATG
jgi:ATP-binding cassette subfamily F protein uup